MALMVVIVATPREGGLVDANGVLPLEVRTNWSNEPSAEQVVAILESTAISVRQSLEVASKNGEAPG